MKIIGQVEGHEKNLEIEDDLYKNKNIQRCPQVLEQEKTARQCGPLIFLHHF